MDDQLGVPKNIDIYRKMEIKRRTLYDVGTSDVGNKESAYCRKCNIYGNILSIRCIIFLTMCRFDLYKQECT